MSAQISILLPVFNGARFLPEQLDSICSQSFTSFELLALDDGSTDNSLDILRSAAADDCRIRIERNNLNLGQKAALKTLIERACAPLIAFSDQDDVWHPEKLGRLAASIGSASLAYGNSPLIDATGNAMQGTLLDHIPFVLQGQDNAKFLFCNSVSGHAILVRRDVVEPYVFCLNRTYDWLIATIATFADGVVYEPEAITYHRMHDNNQVNRLLGKLVDGRPQKKKRKTRASWRQNCLDMRDTLILLAYARAIPENKQKIFQDLSRIVAEEVICDGLLSSRSYDFLDRWVAVLDRLELESSMRAEVALWSGRNLRPSTIKRIDHLRKSFHRRFSS